MEIEVSQSQITSSHQPTQKRQCGICQQYGHNRRKCPNNQYYRTTKNSNLTGVELVCVTLTKHELSIPYNNRSGTSLCDANKAQAIDPRLTGLELVCVMLTKYKLLIIGGGR